MEGTATQINTWNTEWHSKTPLDSMIRLSISPLHSRKGQESMLRTQRNTASTCQIHSTTKIRGWPWIKMIPDMTTTLQLALISVCTMKAKSLWKVGMLMRHWMQSIGTLIGLWMIRSLASPKLQRQNSSLTIPRLSIRLTWRTIKSSSMIDFLVLNSLPLEMDKAHPKLQAQEIIAQGSFSRAELPSNSNLRQNSKQLQKCSKIPYLNKIAQGDLLMHIQPFKKFSTPLRRRKTSPRKRTSHP